MDNITSSEQKYEKFISFLLRERRRQLISQRKLAISAGCTQATIARLENGKDRNPSLKLVLSIANTLGYDIVAKEKEAVL